MLPLTPVTAGAAVVLVLGTTACSRTAAPEPAPKAPACPASANMTPAGQLPSRRGVGSGAEVNALIFSGGDEIRAGEDVKIVWQMTGRGTLSIGATGPGGVQARPSWGPQPHSSSPIGDEWGVGWRFPAAGCWTIAARRTSGSGYLTIRVA